MHITVYRSIYETTAIIDRCWLRINCHTRTSGQSTINRKIAKSLVNSVSYVHWNIAKGQEFGRLNKPGPWTSRGLKLVGVNQGGRDDDSPRIWGEEPSRFCHVSKLQASYCLHYNAAKKLTNPWFWHSIHYFPEVHVQRSPNNRFRRKIQHFSGEDTDKKYRSGFTKTCHSIEIFLEIRPSWGIPSPHFIPGRPPSLLDTRLRPSKFQPDLRHCHCTKWHQKSWPTAQNALHEKRVNSELFGLP